MKPNTIMTKLKFKMNKNLTHKKINGRYVSLTKVPLFKICSGKGIDVGCGSDKITKDVIGIDIIPKGMKGRYGNVKNKFSTADIQASGDNLDMFEDNSLDYVIARDNLEHYLDFLKALIEWKRILKKGGKIGITMPDDDLIDSIALDPTHKHAFNPSSLKTALELVGFKVNEIGTTIENWGFYVIGEKKER